jgi:hypothetical protein
LDGREVIPTDDFIGWMCQQRKSRPIVTLVCRYPAAEATQKVPITTGIIDPQNGKSYWLRIRREKWKLRQL